MTEDGIGMAVGAALCLFSAVFLIITVRHYRQKGDVLSAAYFAASREERMKLRTKKAYRYTAHAYLYLTLISGLFGISFLLDSAPAALTGAVLAMSGMLSGLIYIVTAGKG